MQRIGEILERLGDWWIIGATVIFVLGVVTLAGALSAYIPAVFAAAFFGGTSEDWIIYLAPIWLPIWVGYVAKDIRQWLPRPDEDRKRSPSG